jgi:hypothetical protein
LKRSARGLLARLRGRRSTAEMLYLGILQRHASERELASLNYELFRHGNIEAVVDDMVTSDEFALMRLPHLMAHATQDWCGRYLFFMHVPKTAGTSTRLALTKSAGVPAVTTYKHVGELPREKLRQLAFWPLFIGHGHVDYFPEPHRGITVLRESRSRYLSIYRQRQKQAESVHLRDPDYAERMRHVSQATIDTPFEEWVGRMKPVSSASFFTDGVPLNSDRFIRTGTTAEVTASLERGLGRIDYAAWAHDPPAIESAIARATGDPEPKLDRLNVFEHKEFHRTEPIGPQAREALAEYQRMDALAEDIAVAKGLLPRLSESEADALFETTARRLGFDLR